MYLGAGLDLVRQLDRRRRRSSTTSSPLSTRLASSHLNLSPDLLLTPTYPRALLQEGSLPIEALFMEIRAGHLVLEGLRAPPMVSPMGAAPKTPLSGLAAGQLTGARNLGDLTTDPLEGLRTHLFKDCMGRG